MQVVPVSEVLTRAGLGRPPLRALIPNEQNYDVLLMQPQGEIEADADGVRNRDSGLADRQFTGLLLRANEINADLVITPEYSMPWRTLVNALRSGLAPPCGALWVLGCESLRYEELDELRRESEPFATILYEPLAPDAARFVDPLVYVFQAPAGSGEDRLVLLVQFKTSPMADPDHFEVDGLQLGSQVYEFGNSGQTVRLVSLICSDALAFDDALAQRVYDRALIIHVQLNPNPRQSQFRGYRDKLLGFAGDETELICLNWAQDVRQWSGEHELHWGNIAGSAWYLKLKDYDDRDEVLCQNHQNGLYYTRLQSMRAHALFFNYNPAIFRVRSSKVAHIGVLGTRSRRRGPQALETLGWDAGAATWVQVEVAEDGFSGIVAECGDAQAEITRIAGLNPIEAERVLALASGSIGDREDWFRVASLDSFAVDSTEVIRRLTFCQDGEETALRFRVARLRRCANLWRILTSVQLPPALADLRGGFQLAWTHNSPHQNAISSEGRATVVYMGEESNAELTERVHRTLAERLHRSFADPDRCRLAKQRLGVWWRQNGDVLQWDRYHDLRFDQPGSSSEFDVARDA